jgi:hypothetical protein
VRQVEIADQGTEKRNAAMALHDGRVFIVAGAS